MTDTLHEPQIVKKFIHEIIVRDKRLNRHIHHDPRSKDYPAPLAPNVSDVMHEAWYMPLNQGNVGCCTADALCGALNCNPDYSGTPSTQENAIALYTKETENEGQPYPTYDPGGSGLAVCKAAVQLGWITAYGHTFSLEDSLKALVLRPAIYGVSWYSSFDYPDSGGVVSIASSAFVRGGHEVCAQGISTENRLVWFWNSWGSTYGIGGRFAMSFDTLEQLLADQGDCTVPIVGSTGNVSAT